MLGLLLSLLWLSSLLACWLLLLALWRMRRVDGTRRTGLACTGSVCVILVAAGPLGLSFWAEASGLRPSYMGAMIAWWCLLGAGGIACMPWGSRLQGLSVSKLLACAVTAGLFAVGAFVSADRTQRSELERQLAEASERYQALAPEPLQPADDAGPIYERAFKLLGREHSPPAAGTLNPAVAVRTQKERMAQLLESSRAALEVAREARTLPAYHLEYPISRFHSFDASGGDSAFWVRLRDLASLVALRAALAAADGDAERVQDSLDWLGDIARQVTRGPTLLDFRLGTSLASQRTAVFEGALALLPKGQSSKPFRIASILGGDLSAIAERQIESESTAFQHWMLHLMLGRVPVEDLVRLKRPGQETVPPGTGFVHESWLAFYRVFALPADLAALRQHTEEAIRRLRSDPPNGALHLAGREEILKLGVGPMAGAFVSSLYTLKLQLLLAGTAERVAQAGAAVHAHRLAQGKYPARLEEVSRELLPEPPRDARFGEPLRYERVGADGAVVWSAWDGRDTTRSDIREGEAQWKIVRQGAEELVFLLGSTWETQGLEPIDESDGMQAEEPGEEESDDEPSGDGGDK